VFDIDSRAHEIRLRAAYDLCLLDLSILYGQRDRVHNILYVAVSQMSISIVYIEFSSIRSVSFQGILSDARLILLVHSEFTACESEHRLAFFFHLSLNTVAMRIIYSPYSRMG